MQDFMAFKDAAIQLVLDSLLTVSSEIAKDKEGIFPSSDFWKALASILDLFVILDSMKNIKGSMNNDFSMFKRYYSKIFTLIV
jgi:cytoplasmic FMR1 interacting protein